MKIPCTLKKTILVVLSTCFALSIAWANNNSTSSNSSKKNNNIFTWRNLESDIAGVARHVDPNLINPWGMALSSVNTIWVNDNGTGVATVYNLDGTAVSLVVTIPASASNTEGANPTGIVSNPTSFFKVTKNANSLPSVFIFVSEDGSISGWNPTLDNTNAILAVDNGASNAVYKGATLGAASGHNFLFVTNFHSGLVETYDENFLQVNPGGFADPTIPADFAPFGIRNLNGQIFVTYAERNPANPDDDLAGPGNGFINVFDTSGNLLRRLVSNDRLNAPWGLEMVSSFGKFQNALFVGNFGDGRINAYDPTTGAFLGTPKMQDKTILAFDGLWDLLFINNGLFFTAGIAGEEHGLFGLIHLGNQP